MNRRIYGPLAPALIVFFAACTAAVQDTEEKGESSSAVQGDDDDDTTSSTTTPAATTPTTKATAVAGGLTCGVKTMTLPAALPDVTTCAKGVDTGCEGWTAVGPYVNTSAELRSSFDKGAQLYMSRPGGNTLCLYLYRGDTKLTVDETLHGVHCYDEKTCDVCWWDAALPKGVKPTAAALDHKSGDDCSSCHRNGPLLPLATLWSELNAETIALHNECTKRGGPTWADPLTGTGAQGDPKFEYATPNTALIVKAPAGCGGSGCHANGFAKGGDYCSLISHAFSKTGSMRGTGSFASKADCEQFHKDMECGPGAEHALPCADPEVAP